MLGVVVHTVFFFLIVVFLLCNCLCIMCVVYSPLLGGNKGSIHLLQIFIFLLWYFLCMYTLNFM